MTTFCSNAAGLSILKYDFPKEAGFASNRLIGQIGRLSVAQAEINPLQLARLD